MKKHEGEKNFNNPNSDKEIIYIFYVHILKRFKCIRLKFPYIFLSIFVQYKFQKLFKR